MSEWMECQTGQVTPHIRWSCQRGCDHGCYYSLQRDEAAESADELWTPPTPIPASFNHIASGVLVPIPHQSIIHLFQSLWTISKHGGGEK